MRQRFVVVVTQGEDVVGVIGPRDSELEAQAVADVIRHENGIVTHVMPIREINVLDVHGTKWMESPPKLSRGNL